MWISVDEGPDEGKTVEVTGSVFTIGRHPDCDLVLTDQEASSHHATIEREGDGTFVLRDLKSTNGTFVDGRKLEGSVPVTGSERLKIGQSVIRLLERSPGATVISPKPQAAVEPAVGAAVGQAAVAASPPGPPASPAQPPPAAPVKPLEPQVGGQAASSGGGGPNTAVIVGVVIVALLIVGGVVAFLVTGNSKSTLTAQQIISRSTPSVVRIQGAQGAGSGFVIDASRQLVLTNAHVVVGNSALQAQVGNNEQATSPLQVVGADPCDDLAVVKLVTPLPGLKALKFGSSSSLKPGDSVTVLGFPGSLQQSLNTDQTIGQATSVVANTGTVSQVGVKANPDPSLPNYQSTIVHQAPVNHGDSGGPLLNTKGQVIGVDTLTNTNNQGQYYAISSDYIQRLLPGLVSGQSRGLVGWNLSAVDANDPQLEQELLGLYESIPAYASHAQTLAPRVARFIQQNNINGMFDGGDQPGSPAANASTAGYLIQQINGDNVPTFGQVCNIISSASPGSQVKLNGFAIAPSDPSNLGNNLDANLTLPKN